RVVGWRLDVCACGRVIALTEDGQLQVFIMDVVAATNGERVRRLLQCRETEGAPAGLGVGVTEVLVVAVAEELVVAALPRHGRALEDGAAGLACAPTGPLVTQLLDIRVEHLEPEGDPVVRRQL